MISPFKYGGNTLMKLFFSKSSAISFTFELILIPVTIFIINATKFEQSNPAPPISEVQNGL